MRVREAVGGDFLGVLRLYRQLQPDDPAITDGRDREVFDVILGALGLTIFVVEVGGEIVATCYLNVIPNMTRAARSYAVVENVVVDEGFRGRGYGKAVLRHALRAAWAAGCYKVMLQTGSSRESTLGFYRACGFSADGRAGYVARPG